MAELERTRPWHYSNFNLEAYNRLGRLGEKAGVDIWNFTLDDHSLRKGYQYIAGFINSDTPWPRKDIDKMDDKKALRNIATAAHARRKIRCSVTKRSGCGRNIPTISRRLSPRFPHRQRSGITANETIFWALARHCRTRSRE